MRLFINPFQIASGWDELTFIMLRLWYYRVYSKENCGTPAWDRLKHAGQRTQSTAHHSCLLMLAHNKLANESLSWICEWGCCRHPWIGLLTVSSFGAGVGRWHVLTYTP